jgi:hypothetical protein
MKSYLLAALVLLIVCSHAQAQKLSAEKINNRRVQYAPSTELEKYPLPAMTFQRSGLASEKERTEIVNEIIYPLINESPRAIAAVVVELVPINPHPKTQAEIGFKQMTVLVLWHDGGYVGVLLEKNKDGHFDKDAYLLLLESDVNECEHEEDLAPQSSKRSTRVVATRTRVAQRKTRRL